MPQNIQLKIRSLFSDLSSTDQKIAGYLLDHHSTISNSTINELSAAIGVADSTLFQFARKLGYKGFKDFKLAFLPQPDPVREIPVYQEIEDGDSFLRIAEKVFASNQAALTETKQLLREEDLALASKIINGSNRLFFFGSGASELIAHDAFEKFLRAGLSVFHDSDGHVQLMLASMMKTGDCAFCFSHSGRTNQVIKAAQTAKENGARIISFTSNALSPLAKESDVIFISSSKDMEYLAEAMSSEIAQMSIVDALYVSYMVSHKEESKQSTANFRKILLDFKRPWR
ncbi:MAG: MurR/RpiR family transcriptional regulator [Ileibacterium sp.]|nr:MurR/RpiR family transcriptional regulator [Ileibacterium sp.]